MAIKQILSKENQESVTSSLESSFGGVYILMRAGVPVYVGESACVPARLKEHIAGATKDFDSYRIYYTKDRKGLESTLIRLLTPEYNISENPNAREPGPLISPDLDVKINDQIDQLVHLVKSLGDPIPVPVRPWFRKNTYKELGSGVNTTIFRTEQVFHFMLDTVNECGEPLADLRVLSALKQDINHYIACEAIRGNEGVPDTSFEPAIKPIIMDPGPQQETTIYEN